MRITALVALSAASAVACGGSTTGGDAKPPVAVTEVSLDGDGAPARPDPSASEEERRAALAEENLRLLGAMSAEGEGGLASVLGSSGFESGRDDAFGGLQGATVGESFGAGGLGLRGVGRGGGGTGEGTIGLGGIGTGTRATLGNGAGVASAAPRPEVELGQLTVRGALDEHIVRRIVRAQLAHFRYCYERELAQLPALAGELTIAFTIGADGTVVGAMVARSTLQSASVEGCALARAKTLGFPKPDQGVVLVELPLTLSPPRSAPPPPASGATP